MVKLCDLTYMKESGNSYHNVDGLKLGSIALVKRVKFLLFHILHGGEGLSAYCVIFFYIYYLLFYFCSLQFECY